MRDRIDQLMKNSPLEAFIEKNSNMLSCFEKNTYLEIRDIIKKNEQQKKEPVKMVLTGEVKAGKSSILNVLAGCEVAYTDVLEATCAVSEVHFGPREKVTIFYVDGNREHMNSVAAYREWMGTHCRDMHFFSNVSHIEVEAPTERLKELILVDTPGLLSLREENGERTEKFLIQADVFVWVLNGTKIGQEDVYEQLEALERFGKPVICVVNKKDLLSSSKERILSYVKEDLGDLLQDIFLVSAKEAKEGIDSKNNDLWLQSGMAELYQYLTTKIERRQVTFKSMIECDSCIRQLEKEIYLHSTVKDRLQRQYDRFIKDVNAIVAKKNAINQEIKKNFLEWVKTKFFRVEQGRILSAANEEQLQSIVDEYCSDEYIDSVLQKKYQQLCNEISVMWDAVNDTYFYSDMERRRVTSVMQEQEEDIAKQVGITGAGSGLVIAGYLAWLGPEAASITLAGALASIAPPVAALTGLGYILCKNYQDNKKKQWNVRRDQYAQTMYEDTVSYVLEHMSPKILRALEKFSEDYFTQIISKVRMAEQSIGFRMEELNTLASDITVYVGDLEEMKREYEKEREMLQKEEEKDSFDESLFE